VLLAVWHFADIPPASATLHSQGEVGYIPTSAEPLDVEIEAPQAFVYDCASETILFRKGEERVLYPASTTKLLTALLALEHLAPDEVVTPGDELTLVKAGSSSAYVKARHALRVEMLIEGMLLPSGNDAAYALAAAAGHRMDEGAAGVAAVEVFVREMARYGERIGLVGSRFTTPDGYAGEEHYSTVEDMVLIARLALQNEIIARYVARHEDEVVYASGHENHWVNTNALIDPDSPWYHADVTGLKTGSLDGNYCLLFCWEAEGNTYIAGVFGAASKDGRYADAHRIMAAMSAAQEVSE
jgi:D-alanyl-D-alanine carboxypeptidase